MSIYRRWEGDILLWPENIVIPERAVELRRNVGSVVRPREQSEVSRILEDGIQRVLEDGTQRKLE